MVEPVFAYKVSLSENFTPNGWTYYPLLHVETLSLRAGPSIDEAQLFYRYGQFTSKMDGTTGPTEPIEPTGPMYVKIEIFNPLESSVEPFDIWYGVMEAEEKEILGKVNGVKTGNQRFQVYGLLRLLETNYIRKSHYVNSAGEEVIIERGITFNATEFGPYQKRGNMATQRAGNFSGFMFSHRAYGASQWKASDALKYLLYFHSPKAVVGQVGFWKLTGQVNALDWHDITIPTDSRTVKSVIDEIVDRRRMAGYKIGFDHSNPAEIVVNFEVFTFNEQPIVVPPGHVIQPNSNTVSLNLENDASVERVQLTNNFSHLVDTVVARGEWVTSTFTVFNGATPELLGQGWLSAHESAYNEAASTQTGYDDLDPEEQAELNTIIRGRTQYQDVYSRFVMNPDWGEKNFAKVPSVEPDSSDQYFACVTPDSWIVMSTDNIREAVSVGSDYAYYQPIRMSEKRFLSTLPIPVSTSDSGTIFRDPFSVFQWQENEGEIDTEYKWEIVDQAASSSGAGGDSMRSFSVTTHMLQDSLGIRWQVSAAGGQHMIAKAKWDQVEDAETPVYLNAGLATNGALEYGTGKALATVAIEWDKRLEYAEGAPTYIPSGLPARVMIIDVPDARFDLLLPDTVTDIDSYGTLDSNFGTGGNGNGGILRDDRNRVRQIAIAAAQWYGTKRQALSVDFKSHSNALSIGQLVTTIGGSYPNSTALSVVTSITHNFYSGVRTSIETSYGELDLV